MNTRLLILLGLIATLAVSCKKDEASTPEPEKQYIMPLKIGNKWIYSSMVADSFIRNDMNMGIMITLEVKSRVTRELYPSNLEGVELLDKYEWYEVDGLGIVCNAGYNTVLKMDNLESSRLKADTLIYNTDKEKEIVSLLETSNTTVYHIAYGTLKDINGYPSKLNERYILKKPENYDLGKGFYSYYSRGIGMVMFAITYRNAQGKINYTQFTLRDYIIK